MKTYTLIVGDEHGLRGDEPIILDLTPEILRSRREKIGITRADLAREAKCSAVYINKLERGERELNDSIKTKLAYALYRLETRFKYS